ncbi:MAG TPA: uroporphyrinogen decarboxylase family protein [Desulfotignum sp.]|nr:uroporphyrinogen decarboxylase family protein [Desulfotignum sp.]
MNQRSVTSMQRVLTTLDHQEPDRVPFFLLATLHGAKEVGLPIKTYFSDPDNVVEGQMRLLAKYRHDCIYGFFYAPVEIAAFGGEVVFIDDGPPNSGEPVIKKAGDIKNLAVPDVKNTPCLEKVLTAIHRLKHRVKDAVPIIGVVMSPFSLPVMQMGFDRYFDLMFDDPDLFAHLMKLNQAFCAAWANAQLAAGATAICYFDPVSSTTITTREMYLKTGYAVAQQTLAEINGPTATHMASGRCLPIIDDISATGTAAVGVSCHEDLALIKTACRGKISVIGNLNGIEMCRWSAKDAETRVKEAIAKAGAGGGFILSDNHGEIPFQVPDDVLTAISEAVHEWGRYPLEWTAGR